MAEHEVVGAIQEHNFTNKIVKIFLDSNLSLILILLATILGFAALWRTPREEDPQIDRAQEKNRASRRTGSCAEEEPAWAHRPRIRLICLDSQLRPQVNPPTLASLDERLQQQILNDARQRLEHLDGREGSTDRLLLPDSRGDLWVFRVVVHRSYPALGDGPFVFFNLATVYAQERSFQEAADAYRQALRLEPGNDLARVSLVKALLAKGAARPAPADERRVLARRGPRKKRVVVF